MATTKKTTTKSSSGYQSKKELPNGMGFCTKCQKILALSNFYESESLLDGGGYKCVCKDCCNDIFIQMYKKYKKLDDMFEISSDTITFTTTTELAIKETCRYLDLPYKTDSYEQLKNHIDTLKAKGSSVKSIFGVYKSKLTSKTGSQMGITDLTYESSDSISLDTDTLAKQKDIDNLIVMTEEDLHKMRIFWGKGLSRDDYEFLETELSDWKITHKCDNKAELTLLKEICLKELDLRRAREEGKDVDKLQKGLQDLMKTASVDPAKSNVVSAGASVDSWGKKVKDREMYAPAEWHEKQEQYRDMDGFMNYLSNFVKRPILNFLSGTRNFELIDEKFDGKLDEDVQQGGDE